MCGMTIPELARKMANKDKPVETPAAAAGTSGTNPQLQQPNSGQSWIRNLSGGLFNRSMTRSLFGG